MAKLDAKESQSKPVVVIGGGPAGSVVGCYLSKAGIPNIIFEKAIHPRPHVGESLVSSTTRVLQDLDFVETMEKAGFVRKYGASWHPPKGQGTVAIQFREFPQPGINQDYSYHVDRSKMDLLLLKHAEKLGSTVYQGVGVKEVLFDADGRAIGVNAECAGQTIRVDTPMVVDASGRHTLLGKHFGWKQTDSLFNQFTVHAWFEDVDRGPKETAHDIHIFFLNVPRGWVWQIPIDEKVTSIGVVAEKGVFQEARGDHASWFHDMCRSTPDITRAMENARRVNEFQAEADYSYSMKHLCGDGIVLIGDAARFVDPIFSSGVSVALYSAKIAAERIEHAYRTQDFSAAVFKPYEERIRAGTKIWYEFIRLYYKVLPLFTYFIQHPDYRRGLFQLLQGEVYDRGDAQVLEAMRTYIKAVEQSDTHVFKSQLDPSIPLD